MLALDRKGQIHVHAEFFELRTQNLTCSISFDSARQAEKFPHCFCACFKVIFTFGTFFGSFWHFFSQVSLARKLFLRFVRIFYISEACVRPLPYHLAMSLHTAHSASDTPPPPAPCNIIASPLLVECDSAEEEEMIACCCCEKDEEVESSAKICFSL